MTGAPMAGAPPAAAPTASASAVPTWRRRPTVSIESVILGSSLWFLLTANLPFWRAVHALHESPLLSVSLAILVFAVHALLLCLVATRWTLKPVLWVLLPLTAVAAYYMWAFGIYLDTDMLENVLHTDAKESAELFSFAIVPPLLLGLVPAILVQRVHFRRRTLGRSLLARGLLVAGLLAAAGLAAMLAFQPMASFMRNHKEIRYLVTPANYLTSLVRVATAKDASGKAARIVIAADARLLPRTRDAKPRLLVLVVGETARAANFGLDGYARQTTPKLAALDVVNFPQVTSCGTSTEVSVPCMFSRLGREEYSANEIRQEQSFLHVLGRAGIPVLWRDNQSGCKGVCDGLRTDRLDDAKDPALCDGFRCLDEILLQGLRARIKPGPGDRLVVLHQLGNHGPNYWQRYPTAQETFKPVCQTPDLGKCSREEITNAYDNAILYTDTFLAKAIEQLRAEPDYDTALLYVSDHGESLGEKGLYLHGVPYSIAPGEQTHVPMIAWFSPGWQAAAGLDMQCVRARAAQPASHDNLFDTVFGLLRVGTKAYRPARDLFRACTTAAARTPAASPAATVVTST